MTVGNSGTRENCDGTVEACQLSVALKARHFSATAAMAFKFRS